MFKFLKEKLKGAISKFSKSAEEEAKEKEAEAPIKEEAQTEADEVENLITEAEKTVEPEKKAEEIIEEPKIKEAEILERTIDSEEKEPFFESAEDIKDIIWQAQKSKEALAAKEEFRQK